MKYRNVGKTGLKVSEISLGAWITYGGTLNQEKSHTCIERAIERGVNFIDLADAYARGEAERVVGAYLREENFTRKHLVISSKAFWPQSDDVNDRGLSRKHLMESVDDSLDRLGIDYLDIYFCHRYDRHTPLEEVIRAMSDLIDQRIVHYWGTSVWPAVHIERAVWMAKAMGCHPPVIEQPRYNMLDRYIELDIMDVCKRNGIGIVCFSPLAQGILTGKYMDGIPEGSRGTGEGWLQRNLTPENADKIKQLVPIAKSLGVTVGQLALAWILRREEISSAITGASRPEHIDSNVRASEIHLEPRILNQIEEILNNKPELPGIYHPPW